MAGDRVQYQHALNRWQAHHAAERYSVRSKDGMLAAIFSKGYSRSSEDDKNDIDEFEKEAYDFVDIEKLDGRKAKVVSGLNKANFLNNILADPDISDIIMIGHGNFSSIYCDDDSPLDWRDIAHSTTHLKQGVFEQRFCGTHLRRLSVPLGLFAVTSHRDVYAAPDSYLPTVITVDEDESIDRITNKQQLSYQDIQRNFYDSNSRATL